MQERVGHGKATTLWENSWGEFSNTSFNIWFLKSRIIFPNIPCIGYYWVDNHRPNGWSTSTMAITSHGQCAGGKSDALPVDPNDPRWSKFRHRFTGTAIRPFPLKSLGNMTLLQWEWLVDRWRKQKTEENNSHNLRFGCLLPALWYLWPDNPS